VIVSTLALFSCTAKAQESTSTKSAQAEANQVYVKVIMPIAGKDDRQKQFAVESWIAKDLRKRGQATFSAVTGWVPLDLSPLEATSVWDGAGDRSYCPVQADIYERNGGRIKLQFAGWHPGGAIKDASLADEPGSRAIVGVEQAKSKEGMPFVAVFVGLPHEVPAASGGQGR
jgi:hypothetical protein